MPESGPSSRTSDRMNLARSSSSSSMIVPSVAVGPEQAALLQSARLKLSSMDQEAMKKMRTTMMEYPESGSSKSNSPVTPRFPAEPQGGPRELRPRRSTLSRQILASPELGSTELEIQHDPDHDHDQSANEGKEEVIGDESMEKTPRLGANQAAAVSEIPPSSSADYTIAVLGHDGVGKTTVIERALRTWGMTQSVKSRPIGQHTIHTCQSQIQPGGKLKHAWKVEFLELNIRSLDLSSKATRVWPTGTPAVSGVVFCYDATRSDTLSGLGEGIGRLAPSGIPMVILACKSDPEAALQVDAPLGNSVGEPFNVGLIEVTTQTSEGKSKMRNALRWLLYKLEQRQRRQQRKLPASITIATTHQSPAVASATLEALASPDSDGSSAAADRIMWHQPGLNMTPADGEGDGEAGEAASDHRSSGSSLGWMMKGPPPRTSVATSTEETRVDEVNEQEPPTVVGKELEKLVPAPAAPAVATTGIDSPLYLSIDELLNKLFTAINLLTRSHVRNFTDEPFVRAFFMTYRRFMLSRDLMHQFSTRLREVEGYHVSRDVKNWTMMKITGALVDWTTRYPGDLADHQTQSHFRDILALILNHTFMAHLTGELIMVEHSLSEAVDLDQSWSSRPSGPSSTLSQQSVSSSELVLDSEVLYDFDTSLEKSDPPSSLHDHDKSGSTRSVSTSSLALESNDLHSHHQHDQKRSVSNPRIGIGTGVGIHSVPHLPHLPSATDSDERLGHAHIVNPFGHAQGNDDSGYHRWAGAINMVITMDPRTFATELTRLQWELFAAIRPRDVFRHDFGKETHGPVGRSILFFNHVSRWVSTLILAHPKAKHRARVIERFIIIAHQLRRLNNYDTLYALISGLRETSVDRLASTHALVSISPSIEKDFQSHLKLMDPRGGYVHYRRALQADISHGRASIPLLTTLLGLVNRLQTVRPEDKRVAEGTVQVQWDKFARFGEILGIIPDCQARGPIVRGDVSDRFRRLMEDTPVIENEDGLWERSQLLEPSGGTVGGKVLKRLANLGFS